MALLATQPLLCQTNFSAFSRPTSFSCIPPSLSLSLSLSHSQPSLYPCKPWHTTPFSILHSTPIVCRASRRKSTALSSTSEGSHRLRRVLQLALWTAEAVYILWLFLLPYAPGDPVWAISSDTINALIGLSLNFFFILPLTNAVGIRLIDAPVLHPMSEGLFNFVIGWTLMFAPLLFSDCKRDRYKSSLDVLWGLQMFLTNTFLIPYMAIRLNEADAETRPGELSPLGSAMTNGAALVGIVGGAVCLFSAIWGLYGRMDGGFGNITDRWQYLVSYLGSERLAYAFIWDICLYTIFQPWLIGENLQNVEKNRVSVVSYLRFIPVVGLVAYLLFLDLEKEQ
ncbi:hypothetical protein like AT3G25805 [Hibiscus trionum]|uniref:Transmembrane protein n=1 Tax=Hibiscus trionum TaxID=183268 RepID=A0A9W7J1L1_HIBTR|nr:hypothetical protein like AT3G25805 [Hibiscus trionum]